MKKLCSLTALSFACFTNLICASEIESWYTRDELLAKDPNFAINLINIHTNDQMKKAVEVANEQSSCDEKTLLSTMYHHLASMHGVGTGNVEGFIRTDPRLEDYRARCTLSQSVYKNFTWSDSLSMYMAENDAIGHVINYHGNIVGSDKFGHFFAQGFNYFRKAKQEKKFKDALEYGKYSEETYFGLVSSGVFSYADITANFEGFRFWSMLTPKTTKTKKAYVVCEEGKWKINRTFQWEDYMSVGWDEAVNTSYLRTQKMYEDFRAEIDKTGIPFPLSQEKCAELINHYKHNKLVAKYLVSPRCALMAKEELTPDLIQYYEQLHASFTNEEENQVTLMKFLGGLFHSVWQEML